MYPPFLFPPHSCGFRAPSRFRLQAKRTKENDSITVTRQRLHRGAGETSKSAVQPWSYSVPVCVRWVVPKFLERKISSFLNFSYFCFQKPYIQRSRETAVVSQREKSNNHTRQRKTHSTARQRDITRQHGTTGHRRAQQDTTTHHTTQRGSATAPQNARGNSTAHSNTPQPETPEIAQIKPAPNRTTQAGQHSSAHTEKGNKKTPPAEQNRQ